MTVGLVIGLLTTVVSGVMAVSVLNRYRVRAGRAGGSLHLLLWGLGLVLYFISGLSEVVLAFGWNDLAFRLWYWSGAIMVAAVLGQGTLHLLVRKPGVALSLSIVVGIVAFASLVWALSIPLDASKFAPGGDLARFLTESYRQILPNSQVRLILPPVMNLYGTVLLVGGAVYSAYLFLRKQILPNRVLGNIFIAAGGLLVALGGVMIKAAETIPALSESGAVVKSLGILVAVVLLFIGFQLAVSGSPAPAAQTNAAAAN